MVIPGHLLILQSLRYSFETPQMNALSIRYHDFTLRDTRVTNVVRLVGNILWFFVVVDDVGWEDKLKF